MADVRGVRDKVERILRDWLGGAEIDRDGRFTVRHESARVFIEVGELGTDTTYVSVHAPTNFEIKPSNEFFRYIATHADDYVFGHLSVYEGDDGAMVMFRHSILGDFMDADELKATVGAVVSTANEIDDQIKKQFGGEVFHE